MILYELTELIPNFILVKRFQKKAEVLSLSVHIFLGSLAHNFFVYESRVYATRRLRNILPGSVGFSTPEECVQCLPTKSADS